LLPLVTLAEEEPPCGMPMVSGATPVPVRVAVCGLFDALVVTLSIPVRRPIVVGVKITLIAHELPAATLEPQVFVSENRLSP
jgi:hypothetical protein